MGSLQNKSSFKYVWLALPKYTCQKIWLSCNLTIFKSTTLSAKSTTLKALSLCLKLNPLHRDSDFNEIEVRWEGSLSSQPYSTLSSKVVLPSQKLRLSPEELDDWKKHQEKCVLQFYGASMKNTWVVGWGGILINIDGIIQIKFSWDLGRKPTFRLKCMASSKVYALLKTKESNILLYLETHYLQSIISLRKTTQRKIPFKELMDLQNPSITNNSTIFLKSITWMSIHEKTKLALWKRPRYKSMTQVVFDQFPKDS